LEKKSAPGVAAGYDPDLFYRNETITDHRVEMRKKILDPLWLVDYLDDDRKVL